MRTSVWSVEPGAALPPTNWVTVTSQRRCDVHVNNARIHQPSNLFISLQSCCPINLLYKLQLACVTGPPTDDWLCSTFFKILPAPTQGQRVWPVAEEGTHRRCVGGVRHCHPPGRNHLNLRQISEHQVYNADCCWSLNTNHVILPLSQFMIGVQRFCNKARNHDTTLKLYIILWSQGKLGTLYHTLNQFYCPPTACVTWRLCSNHDEVITFAIKV